MVNNAPQLSFSSAPEALRAQVAARPEAPALIAGGVTSTYAELGAAVQRCGDRLGSLGVRAGDRVAIIGANSADWVISFLGCLDVGAIAVPMNYRLGRAEIEAQLRLTEPRVVLADEGLAATVDPAVRSLGAEFRMLVGDALQGSSEHELPAQEARDLPDPDAPALISFTSGSTGMPKGALIAHRALAAAAEAYATAMRTGPDDRTLVMVPLFHNTGFCDQLAHMIVVGGAVDVLPRFGTAITRATLRERPATFLIAVPGILRLLMIGDGADAIFEPCRVVCYGGSPMPEAWIREMADRWPHVRLYNAYGLTEFTSVSHLLGPEDLPAHAATVGRPVVGVEQLIVDEEGAPLPPGSTGRILISGPTRMSGYWRAPERSEAVLRGRWLDTGDLGSVTAEGYLVLAGRTSDVINRGGEKISPLQVEAALSLQPGVAEAAVVGAPHAIFGQCVVAFVTATAGAVLDIEALRIALRDHVADYAIPEHLVLEDDLPRNAAGKIDRLQLRRVAAATLGGEVSA